MGREGQFVDRQEGRLFGNIHVRCRLLEEEVQEEIVGKRHTTGVHEIRERVGAENVRRIIDFAVLWEEVSTPGITTTYQLIYRTICLYRCHSNQRTNERERYDHAIEKRAD